MTTNSILNSSVTLFRKNNSSKKSWGDVSGLNCKYFLEMLGYYPSIPNIPSCARVSKSVRKSEMLLDLKYARWGRINRVDMFLFIIYNVTQRNRPRNKGTINCVWNKSISWWHFYIRHLFIYLLIFIPPHLAYFRSSNISEIRTDFDALAQLGMLGIQGYYPSFPKKYLQLRPLASPHVYLSENKKPNLFLTLVLHDDAIRDRR